MMYNYSDSLVYYHHTKDESIDNATSELHEHDRFEIFYLISGSGTYTVEGTEYRLVPGCMIIMRPEETHGAHISGEEPYERISLLFSSSVLSSVDTTGKLLRPFLNREGGHGNYYAPSQIDSRTVRACLDAMSQPISSSKEDRKLAIYSNIYTVLFNISLAFETKLTNTSHVPQDLVTGVLEYIEKNITSELNLDLLSTRFYISKSYLNQQFKQTVGTTIWDYILLKRLELARTAIRNGVSVTDAFRNSGFNDYSSFYRRYRSRFGVSPKEDRAVSQIQTEYEK